jgi:hypothetical protein
MSTPAPETAPEAAPAAAAPTEPAAAAPAAPEPAAPAPAAAAAAEPAAAEGTEPEPGKGEADLPQWARDAISKANSEAAKYRTQAKAAADDAIKDLTAKLGKALGLVQDDAPPTVEELANRLAAKDQELSTKDKAALDAQRQLAIYKAANARRLNADELLDSRSFMDRASQIDPADSTALEALVAEVTAGTTRFKATPAAPQGGADLGPGGQATPRTYTKEQLADHDFYMKHRDDIWAAQREGRIR